MAFPAVTYTNEATALAALENYLAAAGGIGSTGLSHIGILTAALANLLQLGAVPAPAGLAVGGAVTQATSKSTGVTLNTVTGAITMNAAALAAAAEVGFTLTNSQIAATDVVVVAIKSGGTSASYSTAVTATAAGSCEITLGNWSAGSLSEAVILNFVVLKGAAT